MKTIARFARKRWAVLPVSMSIRWSCATLVVLCSMVQANPPPHPNVIRKFFIGADDTLLVSTSHHMYFRGSADGSVWAATTPEASPEINLADATTAIPIRIGVFDYTCDHGGIKRNAHGSLAPTALASLPDNDQCRSLAFSRGNLYAATEDKAYVSDDSGAQWTRVPGLPGISIRQLFAGPAHGLYASAVTKNEHGSVAYKYDLQHGWQVLNFGKPALPRLDPDAGWHSESDFQPTLIGMIDDILYASSLAGLIRSLDGGLRWEPSQAGLPDPFDARNFDALDVVFVVRKNAAGMLYAATMRGIYRFGQGEQRWMEVPLVGTRIGHAYFRK